MTEKQYDIILGLLVEKVIEQEGTIRVNEWTIADLEARIKDAEKHTQN